MWVDDLVLVIAWVQGIFLCCLLLSSSQAFFELAFVDLPFGFMKWFFDPKKKNETKFNRVKQK